MRKLITFFLFFFCQFYLAQNNYFENRPKEPLYQKGGLDNFYNYLTNTLDFNNHQDEKDIIIGFVLDDNGKMNHIKVGFCKSLLFENQIKSALENAEKWDVSNQRDKNYFICVKMKLLYEDKRIRGLSKIMWYKQDVLDISMTINEFNNYEDSNKKKLNEIDPDLIYSSAGLEVQPEFPGGQKAFAEYVAKNYKLPNVKGLSGRVFVEFIIEKDGNISNVKSIRDVGYGTGEEAVRLMLACPTWKPGSQFGKPVRVRYSLPIMIQVK